MIAIATGGLIYNPSLSFLLEIVTSLNSLRFVSVYVLGWRLNRCLGLHRSSPTSHLSHEHRGWAGSSVALLVEGPQLVETELS